MAMAKLTENGGCKANMVGFSIYLLMSRWFMVFACLLIMSMAGATYLFSLYSNEIKSSLGYDQTTLNLLSFFKDLGGNVGMVSGFINEVTPPWVVLFMGAIMNFFGYFMIWLAVVGRIAKPPVWQMCFYICIGASSQTFATTGVLVTCVKNFPESRGIVLGLLKGFVGLSGAIITQLYHAFYGNDVKSLVLLIGWLPSVVSCFFLRTVRVMKVTQANELRIFYKLLFISLGLAGFIMVVIVVQNKVSFTRLEYAGSAAVVLILLFAPLILVFKEEFNLWKCKQQILHDPPQVKVVTETPSTVQLASQNQPQPEISELKPISCFSNVFKPPARGEDYTILQAIFSLDFLILFTTTTFGVGGTLTAIDNLGQIGKALGYPSTSITTFVSLLSIWNYLGRVVSGFVSEIFLSKYKFPRPLMLTLVLLLSCTGHLLIAFGVPNSLYVASIIMGFCFGAQWPLIFAIVSELFGLKYYSTLYNLSGGASPFGAYILNVRVAGHLYDKAARRQMRAKGLTRGAGEDLTCIGVECYKMAFLLITGATLISCVVSLILAIRTREFYKGDIYKKFRQQSDSIDHDEETMVSKESITSAPEKIDRRCELIGSHFVGLVLLSTWWMAQCTTIGSL